jgi:hypothetical protein
MMAKNVQPAAAGPHHERLAREVLAAPLAQRGEHVRAIGDTRQRPFRRRHLAGLGLVQVDDQQAGRAAGDADVLRRARPRPADAARVGGGAWLPPLMPAAAPQVGACAPPKFSDLRQ